MRSPPESRPSIRHWVPPPANLSERSPGLLRDEQSPITSTSPRSRRRRRSVGLRSESRPSIRHWVPPPANLSERSPGLLRDEQSPITSTSPRSRRRRRSVGLSCKRSVTTRTREADYDRFREPAARTGRYPGPRKWGMGDLHRGRDRDHDPPRRQPRRPRHKNRRRLMHLHSPGPARPPPRRHLHTRPTRTHPDQYRAAVYRPYRGYRLRVPPG